MVYRRPARLYYGTLVTGPLANGCSKVGDGRTAEPAGSKNATVSSGTRSRLLARARRELSPAARSTARATVLPTLTRYGEPPARDGKGPIRVAAVVTVHRTAKEAD
jgi:hypothetical protein